MVCGLNFDFDFELDFDLLLVLVDNLAWLVSRVECGGVESMLNEGQRRIVFTASLTICSIIIANL